MGTWPGGAGVGTQDHRHIGRPRHPRARTRERGGLEMHDDVGTDGHVPVMLDRVLELLEPAIAASASGPDPVVVDANLGLGGHTEALLAAHPTLHVIGIDRDPFAIEHATRRLA